MSRIINEIVTNHELLRDYKRKPEHNLVKIQTLSGSSYLGYIKDSDDDGVYFEPLFDDFHPAYIFKTDIKKIIIPTNPDEQIETLKRERSWFNETK
ncbi:MAG: hypothetical protein O8C58_05765 [Candidatus Methanoperedens sp.]|jgi:hypothetical protein|nr:hypothetical protein [Candidatus Methanoperedens sp.]MCZ7373232.1 hypothetical protein [Candidatus Methanoperedens sp.]